MLKIYETVQLNSSNHVTTATIVLIISIAIAGLMTFKVVTSKRKKIIDLIWASSIASALFSLFFIIGVGAIEGIGSDGASSKELNKDQYQLKIINNQIIKTDDDKHVMKIDDKEFDAF